MTPDRHRGACVVDEPRLEALHEGAGRAGPGRPRPVGDEVVQRLGGAHHLHQLQAEAIGPGLEDRRRQRLAGGHAEAEGGQVETPLDVGHLQHPGVEGRDREEHRGSLGVDHCEARARPSAARPPARRRRRPGPGSRARCRGRRRSRAWRPRRSGRRSRCRRCWRRPARRPPRRPGGCGSPPSAAPSSRRCSPSTRCPPRSWAPPPPAAWPGPAPRRSRPPGGRPPADHQHGPQPRAAGPRGEYAGGHRGLDDGRPGAAVVEKELVLRLAHQGVHRHGDGAELGRPPEGGGEGRRVVEGQQHALLGLDPSLGQGPGSARHPVGDLPVGDGAAPDPERGAGRPALGHVAIDEE